MASGRPLRVLIAGGGIGGLVAAIALRRAGHDVEVFEQSSLSHETGAAVHLGPNCNGLLRRLGLRAETIGAVECLGNDNYSADGELEEKIVYPHAGSTWGHPWHLVHRQALHTALRELAQNKDGEGSPVQLHLSSRVKYADPDAARFVFEDGTEVQGDLIIGADGVHSRTRKAIPGGDLTPFDSGKSGYRFLIPTAALATDPRTAKYVEEPGHMVMWTKKPQKIVMYPCNDGHVMNFIAMHPSHESAHDVTGSGAAWQETGDKERLLQIYSEFAPSVLAVLNKVDGEKLKVWNLLDLATMPSFVNNKLAVLGDAAHPFLPRKSKLRYLLLLGEADFSKIKVKVRHRQSRTASPWLLSYHSAQLPVRSQNGYGSTSDVDTIAHIRSKITLAVPVRQPHLRVPIRPTSQVRRAHLA